MYIKPFEKRTYLWGSLYGVAFCFLKIFGGKLLSLINIDLISNNLTFGVYVLIFICSLICFSKLLINSIKRFDTSNLQKMAIIGIITFVAIVICGIMIDLIGITNFNENNIDTALNSNRINYILTAIAAIFFAPITEELFFRFLIYRSIEKINPVLSHICVALLFGFFHIWGYVLIEKSYIQLINMLPYMCMSLGFSILYQKAKNIWYPIILHGIINFIAIVL